MNTVYIVVPCYNEQEVIRETARRLADKMSALAEAGRITDKSRVVFVNDGSKDATLDIIKEIHCADNRFAVINLSRNRGHQNALLAGLIYAGERADAVISLDADLQDDINAIDSMLTEFENGSDIVYAVRSNRKKDGFFKRVTAEGFYRVMNILGAETVFNHADYRLMSKRAIQALSQFHEVNLFLRGLVPMVGYKSSVVYYERADRFAGKSKYPLGKMVSFAVEGITSLSTKPIKLIALLGFAIFFVSIIMMVYFIVRWAIGETVSGWASLVCSVWGIGGLIMLSIGVIGEYIGKIYLETKDRPKYIIESVLDDEK